MTKITRTLVLAAAVVAIWAPDLLGQGTLASQTLGRAYWHVCAAYAIAWILVFAWVITIARRLASVEQAVKGG